MDKFTNLLGPIFGQEPKAFVMAFDLTAFLQTVEFPDEEARIAYEAWLRRIGCTTWGSLQGMNFDSHAPEGILLGWTAALRTAIAMHQAEAGMSCTVSSNFLFVLHRSDNNSSTFSFSIPIATSSSSSLLPPFEQHPPPHPPPQVCVSLRHTYLLPIHIPLNLLRTSFLCRMNLCALASCCAYNATRYEFRYSSH